MKKAILIAAGVSLTSLSWAQKQNIQTANDYLRDKDYDKAVEYINIAVNNPDTKDNVKAWFTRGNIYMAMQNESGKNANSPYREAATSFLKAAQLDAKYEKDAVTQALIVAAYNYYNDAVGAYNKKEYEQAMQLAKSTVDIHDMEGGKRFANKGFDTVSASALMIESYSALYAKKYDEALVLLQALKANPIEKNANVYLALVDVYRNLNKDAEMIAIIEEGKALYPDNVNLRNEELNYYIKAGKQDVLMKKLEDAVAKEPNNAELLFNLANGYNNLAFPKDATGKEGARPSNFDELFSKAESNYQKALAIDGTNGGYNYNMGVLYYNMATDNNRKMNELADLINKSKVPAEKKKLEDSYAKFNTTRDANFEKALPFLVKTVAAYEPNAKSLSSDDKFSYQSALIALKEIYARKNDMAKSAEYKAKLEASKAK